MNFKYDVETKTGVATATAPQSTPIVLTPGIVEQVAITFPAGCAGLVGLRVLRGLFQVWPLTSGEWYISDNFTIVQPDSHKVEEGADRFRVETYNTDTKYDHTLHVRFSIALPETLTAQMVALLEERLPVDLPDLVSAVTEIRGHSGQSVEIMRDELIPILQGSLKAQQKLLAQSYDKMTLKEILNL